MTNISCISFVLNQLPDYELIDAGYGRKLERYGDVLVDRPEAKAVWPSKLEKEFWAKADAIFSGTDGAEKGKWQIRDGIPSQWAVSIADINALCRFNPYRHVGIFPEQLPNWQWMNEVIKVQPRTTTPRILNLFAYTGVASLVAASAGAQVVHVDASKQAITQAKANQIANPITEGRIRFIMDDARKFIRREIARGHEYNGIILDPPKLGHGPKGEVWNFSRDIKDLLSECSKLLEPKSGFVILTWYANAATEAKMVKIMSDVFAPIEGAFETGELAIQASSDENMILPCASFVRFKSNKLIV